MELTVAEVNRLSAGSSVAEERAPFPQQDRGFRDLIVWQVALEFVGECYGLTAHFPSHEGFGLTGQLRRAAVSVTSNIAEGWGRSTRPDFARFVDMSSGSLCETENIIEVALYLGYINRDQAQKSLALAKRVGQMLHKLRQSLRSKRPAPK